MFEHLQQKRKKSIGALFLSTKTKPTSPDLTGQVTLQRHTMEAIAQAFSDPESAEAICNIAAWTNVDKKGRKYLTVEISPKFISHGDPMPNNLGFVFNRGEEEI